MKKNKIMRRVAVGLVCFLSGCFIALGAATATAEQGQENPVKIYTQNELGAVRTYTVKDYDTGVQYVVVRDLSHGGIAITPRLNSNGSLYGSQPIEQN